MTDAPDFHDSAPLWRDQRFVLLLSARVISVRGNGFARVALAFAVLALPGAGAGRLSLVPACQALPQRLFILIGGVIAGRMSRSRLMVTADVLGCGAYAGLAAMVLTGHAPLVAMCVPAVVAGTATTLFAPAMDGLVPLLVPAGRLQRANGLLRMSGNSALLLGLALAGVTVALVGAGWALALNATFFAVSAVLTLRLRVPARLRKKASEWADLREGWQEFAGRQWLWVVVAQYAVVVAPLGPLVAGPVAAAVGTARALAGCAALIVLAGAAALLSPQVRGLRADDVRTAERAGASR